MTLFQAPNGAKDFYIACRTRCTAKATESWSKEKYFFSHEGDRTQRLSSEEPAFDPSAKGLCVAPSIPSIHSDHFHCVKCKYYPVEDNKTTSHKNWLISNSFKFIENVLK